ncbi:MAG: hypothetical protein QOG89_3448, partial [Thermomicrobiales bacterium]|nr:hypothetical protein [Thermomicrobiales bacterium]
LSRKELHARVKNRTADAVNKALRKLHQDREVGSAPNGDIAILPKGQQRLMTQVVAKLKKTV